MQTHSTVMVPTEATSEQRAIIVAENEARKKMMSEITLKNIFKFVKLLVEAACKNSAIFSGKVSFIKKIHFIFIQFIYIWCNRYYFRIENEKKNWL